MVLICKTPAAETDLQEIWLAIAVENEHAATKVLRAIGDKIGLLADQPRIGPRREDIRPATRLLLEGPYLILYETDPNTDEGLVDIATIVRVIDGRRDLKALI